MFGFAQILCAGQNADQFGWIVNQDWQVLGAYPQRIILVGEGYHWNSITILLADQAVWFGRCVISHQLSLI